MFAGEKAAQLEGVRHHLDSARQALVTPIAASHYAAIADGFFSTQISALGETTWLVRNRGALQTVRFDDVADISVDFCAQHWRDRPAAQGDDALRRARRSARGGDRRARPDGRRASQRAMRHI